MRLIDADALMHTHKSEVATIGKDWTVDDLATAIETAPTIDAIQVGWLREKMLSPQMTDGNPFGFVLDEWMDEQEAR